MGEHYFNKDTLRNTIIKENRNIPEYANIYVKPHSKCAKRDTYGGSYVGKLGDVRRCEHGKIQMLVEPARYYGGRVGPGAWFWETLHPVWDFFLYWKAVQAMA